MAFHSSFSFTSLSLSVRFRFLLSFFLKSSISSVSSLSHSEMKVFSTFLFICCSWNDPKLQCLWYWLHFHLCALFLGICQRSDNRLWGISKVSLTFLDSQIDNLQVFYSLYIGWSQVLGQLIPRVIQWMQKVCCWVWLVKMVTMVLFLCSTDIFLLGFRVGQSVGTLFFNSWLKLLMWDLTSILSLACQGNSFDYLCPQGYRLGLEPGLGLKLWTLLGINAWMRVTFAWLETSYVPMIFMLLTC